ncbi:hypothetical protein [Cyanobium sp. Aljojuca 7A6]|uniref:hypothetical protein n=1 Tax=Cyanobium sp. Aljojuca 7A6 TaxID=2823697 RepID=UPI0020CCBC78|nr:hypothetical protein [Cyanobium sp. Aljojuca 7A6]
MFTTPLLGYPVYVDDILIRKDILILLIFAVVVKFILHVPSARARDAMAVLILTAGVLSHELLAFIGLPSVAMIMLISSQLHHWDAKELSQKQAVLHAPVRFRSLRSLLWLLIPLGGMLSILAWKGTRAQAYRIGLSWIDSRLAANPQGIQGGAIGWIGMPSEKFVEDTQKMISQLHFGIPTWSLVIVLSAGGVFLVASAIARRDAQRAWLYVLACLFQFTVMIPIFYHAMDTGRWVIMCLFSAFILTIETPDPLIDRLGQLVPCPSFLYRFSTPPWLCPVFLALWGMPITLWKPWQFVLHAPVGFVAKTYFYLRILGMPRPTELLG